MGTSRVRYADFPGLGTDGSRLGQSLTRYVASCGDFAGLGQDGWQLVGIIVDINSPCATLPPPELERAGCAWIGSHNAFRVSRHFSRTWHGWVAGGGAPAPNENNKEHGIPDSPPQQCTQRKYMPFGIHLTPAKMLRVPLGVLYIVKHVFRQRVVIENVPLVIVIFCAHCHFPCAPREAAK